MVMIWNEARIRAEFARLDKLTGLNGAALPITFSRAQHTLGMFSWEGEKMSFRFSNYWFQNPDWPEESALDVIRHEYAHYMDHVVYGGVGHKKTWRMCCLKVGAMPSRLYNEELNRHYVKQHQEEAALSQKYNVYREGQPVLHPKFGEGVITAIEGEGVSRVVVVEFEMAGRKRLGIQWLDENCAVDT